jgi:peptide/nickel transport system permease protein
MRTVDLLLSMPSLVVVLTLVGVLGIGTLALVAAVAASVWPTFARMAHGLSRQALVRPDVLTARMMGITGIPLVTGHVLPGVFGEVLGLAAFYYAEVLGIVAGLSFVGLGIQPPSPEWGSMLSESQPYFSVAPWLVYMPVLGIVLLTIVTVTVASAIRSAISPIYKAPSDANPIQHAALGGRS